MLGGVEAGTALRRLAGELGEAAMELAGEVVERGIGAGISSLERVDEVGRLGDIPIFIAELAGEVAAPEPDRIHRESPLASLARDHARRRESLGFVPREVVTEFLVLRRVLWRFVARRSADLGPDDLLIVERRLNDLLDQLVIECVVAYFEWATSELARQARHDPLTGLLNHQAFSEDLAHELDRSKRYGHGLALAFMDVDRFKEINDTLGHREGDAVLRTVAALLAATTRRSDLIGRLGGDEFAVALVESDPVGAGAFLERVEAGIEHAVDEGSLPVGFSLSPGWALFPAEAEDAEGLFRLADSRSYEIKRSRSPEP